MADKYDVIIIGGGSAGLTAAIYSARRMLHTLVVTEVIGGQAALPHKIENYPGFLSVKGSMLMERFQKQAQRFGVEIIFDKADQIIQQGEEYLVKTGTKEFLARAVIIAVGKTPRSLDVPGEEKFRGKGVSYCATCDAPFFKNKTVAVVGGGNCALDAALLLSKIAIKVYLIHRRDEFRGFEAIAEEVKKKENVEIVLNGIITEIKGEQIVKSISVKDLKTEQVKEIPIDGLFIEIGYEIKPDLIKNLVKTDENNHIIVNEKGETFYIDKNEVRPGIFAAGDVTSTPFKQIVISAGEGAKAALQAYAYLHGTKELPSLSYCV